MQPNSPREIPDRSMPQSATELPTSPSKELGIGSGTRFAEPYDRLEVRGMGEREPKPEEGEVGSITV